MEPGSEHYYTRDFLFENGTLFLFKRRYIHKTVIYAQISEITLSKGSYLKRPKLSLVFGFLLIVISLAALTAEGFSLYGFLRSGIFFVLVIGIYITYNALPIHKVIKITMDHGVENFSIDAFEKSKVTTHFIEFLEKEFAGKFKIEARFRD